VEDVNDRALRSSQAWTDGATRFLKDYVAESQDAASATERAFGQAFSGAEDTLIQPNGSRAAKTDPTDTNSMRLVNGHSQR
jgi:lambda family phage tail tape measure protein